MGEATLRRRPLAQLLVDSVLRPGDVGMADELLSSSVADVVEAADLHRVAPAVFRRLRNAGGAPGEWLSALGRLRHEQLMRHLRAVEDLAVVGGALDAADIPWVAVKGPVLADVIWPSTDMRQYFDLDLIVDRRTFAGALEVVMAVGSRLLDRNWTLVHQTMRAELALVGIYGTPIDLHWDMAVTPSLRRAFPTDIAGMLRRSGLVTLSSGRTARVLDPVDTVLHLVFHAAQAGANKLVWLADVRFASAAPGFSWDEFCHRAEQLNFEVPASMVIARVLRTLDFPRRPPAAVLAPSRGPWGRLAAWRDRQAPFPGLPGDPHLGGNLYSGARRGFPASTVTTARGRVMARHTEAALRQGQVDGDRALHRDVPNIPARTAYFRQIGGQDRP